MIYFIVIALTVQFGFLLFNLTLQSFESQSQTKWRYKTANWEQILKLDIVMAMNVWNKLFDVVDESSIVIWRIFRSGVHWKYSTRVYIHNVFRRSRATYLRVFYYSGSFADCSTSFLNIFHFKGHRFCGTSVFQGEWYPPPLAVEVLCSRIKVSCS